MAVNVHNAYGHDRRYIETCLTSYVHAALCQHAETFVVKLTLSAGSAITSDEISVSTLHCTDAALTLILECAARTTPTLRQSILELL